MAFDVFISVAREDYEFAKKLKAALAKNGCKAWLAFDEIALGELFPDAIAAAIRESKAFVQLISLTSERSFWLKIERGIVLALPEEQRPEIIPLRRGSDLTIPEILGPFQGLDFTDDTLFDQTLKSLVTALAAPSRRRVGSAAARQAKTARVCFISSEYPPHIHGGLGIHVTALTTALAEHMQVDVLLPDPPDGGYETVTDKVHPQPVGVTAEYSDEASWVRYAAQIPRKIQTIPPDERPQVIHCHDWVTVLGGIACKYRFNIPLVFHVHLPNRSSLCASIENLGLVSADIVTVNSEDARREVTERGFSVKEVHVIPNGVDGNLFAPSVNWPTDGGYLLYVGRLVEQKGLEYLLRALDHVRAKFPGVRLKVAGTGEFEDWLKILCSSLSLDDHVEFLGWKDQTELPSLVQNAAAIVVPSIFEPFGMVALEAFACKRPVIASRVGGLREIVQHGKSGFLAEARDHLDLAQWIMAILSDAGQRSRLGEAGFNQLSRGRYTWASIAREFIKVYGSVRADTSRPPGRAAEFIQQIRSSAPRGQEEPWRKFFDDLFVQGQS